MCLKYVAIERDVVLERTSFKLYKYLFLVKPKVLATTISALDRHRFQAKFTLLYTMKLEGITMALFMRKEDTLFALCLARQISEIYGVTFLPHSVETGRYSSLPRNLNS
jgi:hypothetical protein